MGLIWGGFVCVCVWINVHDVVELDRIGRSCCGDADWGTLGVLELCWIELVKYVVEHEQCNVLYIV